MEVQYAHLFKNIFEPELIKEFEEKVKVVEAKEGDKVISIGQTVRVIPFLLKGSLKVSRLDDKLNEIFLYYLNAMEGCAMTFTCCMQQFPSEVQAVAEEDVTFLAIPISVMDEWIVKYPTWKSFVMRTIRSRFNELMHAIDQLAFQKLDERLVNYLKEKSKLTGSAVLNLSHTEIANDLASSREVISRLLKKLELDGRLLIYRNQIKLLNAM
ncbi:MAG: Crp/Fnr family transcriptional regulator [Bacteroidota bacterium]|jgi:CRP/FNR family transcriptional regulator